MDDHDHDHPHAEISETDRPGYFDMALGAEMISKLGYYERWLTAFAVILFQKGVLTPTDLARKMQEIEERWPAEPDQRGSAAHD